MKETALPEIRAITASVVPGLDVLTDCKHARYVRKDAFGSRNRYDAPPT